MARSYLGKLKRAARNSKLAWQYAFNLSPTLAYRLNHTSVSGEAARVLADLDRDGVAITTAEALLGPASYYGELSSVVDRLEHDRGDDIASARMAADDHRAIGRKTFVFKLLGERPILDPTSVFGRFSLQRPILQIANAYFGMYTRLRYYNVWHTLRTLAPARESQLWHYDREDHQILKVFVYLSDVDNGAGPFTYAAGSHPKGRLRRHPNYVLEGGVRRSDDLQMAEAVPREGWVEGVGPKGTIIFADTRGYHKGGLTRERDRIMYVCMFTSPASESEELLQRPERIQIPPDKECAFALSAPKRLPRRSE
jgi:hypothetical protein